MQPADKPIRDELGNIVSPELPADFWQEYRNSRWTYVFHFREKDGFYIEVDYEKFTYEDMRTDLPKQDLVHYKLFEKPVEGTDEWFAHRNLIDSYVSRFFGPVLRNRHDHTDISKIDYFTVVIPKEKLEAISNFTVSFGLDAHKDFIIYLIAKIEEIFVDDIQHLDTPEERKRIKDLPKEIEDFIKVLKLSQPDYGPEAYKRPELQHVTFHYNTIPTIKISNYLLTSNLTKGAIEHLDGASRKDWEKQLKSIPSIFTPNQQPGEFRPRICKALHRFFKEINAFDFGSNNTTNREAEAIARILNFALVPFRNNKSAEYDIDIDMLNVIPMVKQYISRKELAYNKTHFTVNDIKPDFPLLEKYFEKDFLMYGRPFFDQKELLQVLTITDRFNCNEIFPNVMYIFSCLKAKSSQLGHQFECCFNKEIENNEDYRSWQKMLDVINNNGSISELTFKADAKDQEYKFSEKLSTDLIKEALKDYYNKNRFEFEIDFYESVVEHGGSPGSFKLVISGKLHSPQNRFLPKFTKACYRFLLEQLPPSEREYNPSDKYFMIIALLLQDSYFFIRNQWPEDFLKEKVSHWYKL